MTDRWSPQGYPADYVQGFTIPDEEAVENVADYLNDNEIPVDGIAIEIFEGKKSAVVYHAIVDETPSEIQTYLDEINWSDPKRVSNEYAEYASTFYRFDGPQDQQERRAHLLAEKLGVRVTVYEPPDMRNTLSIPALNRVNVVTSHPVLKELPQK